MAESETRLETLEDEVKVLKGQVKRTLVDLRALLMSEDSPLGQRVVIQQMANGGSSVPGMPTATPSKLDSLEGLDDLPEARPPQSDGPHGPAVGMDNALSADLPPESELNLPVDDLPGGPPQAGLGPIPGLFADGPVADHPEIGVDMPEHLDDVTSAGLEASSNHHNTDIEADSPPPSKNGAQAGSNGKGHAVAEEAGPALEAPAANGRVSSVYDEYRELLEETQQTHSIEDEPVGPPLDINLLSNLVYWTALAKRRVGEEQLKDILKLYIQSGHSRPELQDLLIQMSRMVDAEPVSVRENPREWVDLIFHLHGILTGGFPVIKIPPINLSPHDETREGQG